MADRLVVDAHVHVLPERVLRQRDAVMAADAWFASCHAGDRMIATERELLAYMDADGIDRAVVLPWPFRDPALCREATDFSADLQRRHPRRVIGFGIVQPGDPGAVIELERIAQLGLRGVGELNADAQGFALEDDVLAALGALSAHLGLHWTVHCTEPVGHQYPGKGTATPDRIAALAERTPELHIIAAHLGGGLPLFAHMPEIRQLCSRLWFDTAALPFLYAPSVLEAVVGLVGSNRVLFGSDFPLLGAARYRKMLDESGLGDRDRAAILGGAAAELFG